MESLSKPPGDKEDVVWHSPTPADVPAQANKAASDTSRSSGERRHSSSASSSSISANRDHSPGSNGRRTRPSVTSVAASLPAVREMHDRRNTSQSSLTVPPIHHSSVSSDETVVSTKKALTNFQKVAARDPRVEENRVRKLSQCKEEYNQQKSVYDRLVDWADSSYNNVGNQILGLLATSRRRPPLPSKCELLGLANHYYPARADLKVQVCDFGLGRAERTEITLGRIEEYWQSKPDWVDVTTPFSRIQYQPADTLCKRYDGYTLLSDWVSLIPRLKTFSFTMDCQGGSSRMAVHPGGLTLRRRS